MCNKHDGSRVELFEVSKKRMGTHRGCPVITTAVFTDYEGTKITVETNSPAFIDAFNTPGLLYRFMIKSAASMLIEDPKETPNAQPKPEPDSREPRG